jgi:7,8-dihydro-6-hydroxymethylpterin dimethyltransferase
MSDFKRDNRPYIFYGQTQSLCEECMAVVPAKILFEDGKVYYRKRCKEHGFQKTMVSTDIEYFKRCKDYVKPGDMPQVFQTEILHGCPYDCGLCPDHEQHTCLGLIEVIDECNMRCPVCFAMSGPGKGNAKSMKEIRRLVDTLIESEKEPDVVQLSGGEPTLHPNILEIIDMCKDSPIRHVMINTNGIRIGNDEAFVEELAKRKKGFEVYLQFDSLRAEALTNIRGGDFREQRQKALRMLEKHGISTTLVCVIKNGVNDDEVDDIIEHAQQWKCVRGVSFQPIQDVGRNDGFDPSQRTTLSHIRRRIVDGRSAFGEHDMVPLPCHPEHISIGYAIKSGGTLLPVTSLISKDDFLKGVENSVVFEQENALKRQFFRTYSLATTGENAAEELKMLLCCMPKIDAPNLTYDDVFRITIVSFMDKYDFCISAIKRSCIHFIEDGKIYPFETYNMFYRKEITQGQGAGCATKPKVVKVGAIKLEMS